MGIKKCMGTFLSNQPSTGCLLMSAVMSCLMKVSKTGKCDLKKNDCGCEKICDKRYLR